jgi:hypothetical protein
MLPTDASPACLWIISASHSNRSRLDGSFGSKDLKSDVETAPASRRRPQRELFELLLPDGGTREDWTSSGEKLKAVTLVML